MNRDRKFRCDPASWTKGSHIGSGTMATAIAGCVAKAEHTVELVQSLEALGLLMIGLAKNGAGTWDIAMNVDIDSNRL